MISFGTPDTLKETFYQMNVKSLALIIPAILFGHYIDQFVNSYKYDIRLKVCVQTIINIILIYSIHVINYKYAKEFQTTLAGFFFSGLYFGMQTKYISNIKSLLDGEIK